MIRVENINIQEQIKIEEEEKKKLEEEKEKYKEQIAKYNGKYKEIREENINN